MTDEPGPLRKVIEVIPPVYRDVVAAALIIAIIMGGLWGYTGQPFPSQAPLVVVESGSMMHDEPTYGRLGTIDPGDLILVKSVDGADEITTMYGALGFSGNRGEGDRQGYGSDGDVVIYRPYGDVTRVPIIHRAITWVEVELCGSRTCYSYHDSQGHWRTRAPAVDLPEVGLRDHTGFTESGWVTKGDNPSTNREADQIGIVRGELVQPDWIIGKARGEVAWIGLLKFIVQGNDARVDQDPDGTPWCRVARASAPCDTFVMLWVTLGVLILIPVVFEGIQVLRRRRDEARQDLDALARTPPPPDQEAPWGDEGHEEPRPPRPEPRQEPRQRPPMEPRERPPQGRRPPERPGERPPR